MKTVLSRIIALLLMIPVLFGEKTALGQKMVKFDFYYSITETEYTAGQTAEIDVTTVNAGLPFKYKGSGSGFAAEVELYTVDENLNIYTVEEEPRIIIKNYVEKIVLKGEYNKVTYRFIFPEDVKPGQYNLRVCYKNSEKVFEDVLTVI